MKRLQMLLVGCICAGVFLTLASFRPENKPAEKKQVFLLNFKPVATRCLTAAGVPYAVHTVCAPNPGSVCGPTQCPGGLIAINRRPVIFNCVVGGQVVAFANNCMVFAGSICAPNGCP